MLEQFNPALTLKFLSQTMDGNLCNVFMAVPTMYSKLMDLYEASETRHLDFSHLRLLTSGSAPLLVKEFLRIKKIFGKEPVEREGMSETGMNFSNPITGERKPGSIGRPLPGLIVRIVDPDSQKDVEPGEIGEIWLKGPGITPGYWRKPEETQKTFVEGWFRTGDLGRVDSEGYYYLTDRLKHIIISGGENVSAKEVERVIDSVEGVVESAVVGIPDEKWGETVAAAVVLKPGAVLTPRDIRNHCRRDLHKWKSPKKILFVDELPRNSMGKVLNEAVKRLF
jgi:malonyl-CoA/methylmalonyl-CoA synthetase